MISNMSNDVTLRMRGDLNDLGTQLGDKRQWESDQRLVE